MSRINTLPTIATAVSIVAALIAGVTVDRAANFWVPCVMATMPVLVGLILLVVWDVGEAGRLAGFILTGSEGGMFSYSFLWTILIESDESVNDELGNGGHGQRRRRTGHCYGQYECNRAGYVGVDSVTAVSSY